MRPARFIVVAIFVVSTASMAWQTAKKPLTHDVYDSWKNLAGISISRTGKCVAFSVTPQVGDSMMHLRTVASGQDMEIPRGAGGRFTRDEAFYLATIVPAKADMDKAKKEKKAPKDQPKNNLQIVNLSDKSITTIERVKTWRLPAKDSGWIAYQLEEAPTPPKADAAPAKPPVDGAEDQGAPAAAPGQEKKKDAPAKKKEHTVGSEWTFRRLRDQKEFKLADVADLNFNEVGSAILYSVSNKEGDKDGLYWRDLDAGTTVPIATGKGQYKMATIAKNTGSIAFLTDRDHYEKDPTEWSVHLWKKGDKASTQILSSAPKGIHDGFVVVNRGSLRFSESGQRLFVATGPKPEPEAKPSDDTEEKAVLDVWSSSDKVLMPQQLLQAGSARSQMFEALYDLRSKRLVQLEDESLESVTVGDQGDGPVGLAVDDQPYLASSSWTENPHDVYTIDLTNGSRRLVAHASLNDYGLDLTGSRAVFFDRDAKQWKSMDLSTGAAVTISNGINRPLWDTEDDHPTKPNPAGDATMVRGGMAVITDSRDLWLVDLAGKAAPKNLTNGVGFARNWTFWLAPIADEDETPGIDPKQPLLLRVVDQDTMATGYFRKRFDSSEPPQKLVMGDYLISQVGNAPAGDVTLFRRSTFDVFPDLMLTNSNYENPVRISDANPQMKDYNWGKSELVNWISADGVPLKGMLIKPSDFDPSKKYPMIVYFYEKSSQDLHQFVSPAPSASTINPSMYASQGYIVFEPDIPYTIGYPGESAEKAIISGTLEVLRRGYVDPKRVGIQGQSWGGYQVMHLITRTKLYAAAGAGAAVSNMTSAYGGIRLGSGLVRQFQYEIGQSRIGGSIWEKPLQYLENSPLFWADKVETPVLMMNNDADDAVPFQQGVEMFTALRRLGKTAWMLNYNNDKHNLMQRANRKDLSIRLQQFFDHYLKGAPMPKWMAEGVPATKKGKDYGFELTKPGG